jgi:hypothetical protein
MKECKVHLFFLTPCTPWLAALCLVLVLAAQARAFAEAETFGAEPNPTGDPIGGGPGYRRILTTGDFVVRAKAELLAALRAAKPKQVIFVPDGVEMDVTGLKSVTMPAGVTLASCRGLRGAKGGTLFSNDLTTAPLFVTGGDEVRLTGLNLRGPDPERSDQERTKPESSLITTTHYGLEVDNCEVSAWSYAGICPRRGATHVYVHHNFIHHCQRAGLGYGVSLDQADALIEANIFDWCRHHIAATGAPGTSYEARYNIVLTNASSHYFDMHGGRDRGDGTDIAGDWMKVHHNTFQGLGQRAIVIRGTPSQLAHVHHNWFWNPDVTFAVKSPGNTLVERNAFGKEKTIK